ncbi:hypothetical protein D9757_002346 [Collybiopsis confluens]|uniref:Uncharacterized protein n=1 Tax=Collybiopsis confluens TaxID=2823264 RepID=A0A8H5HY36_9AGAR|nr:hypothetical protein D9757_002346 [Collybiopsis confluens]
MAKGKPVGVIKVKVPRHNSQRLGAKLTAEIKHQATDGGVRTDIGHPRHDMNQAIENASEWNSLLLTAKSKRGPQWDVGTQQFHVEEHSELYYDPTELRDSAKKQYEEENGPEQEPEIPMPRESAFHLSALSHPPPNRHPGHGPHTGGPPPPVNYPYPNSPMRAPPGSGPGMMPPNQFGGRHEPFPPRPPPAMMRGGMPMNMALGGNMGGPVGGMGGPVGGMGGNMGGGLVTWAEEWEIWVGGWAIWAIWAIWVEQWAIWVVT